MAISEAMNFILQKLKEALLAVENLGTGAMSWLDKVFPPETREHKIRHWFHVVVPFLVAAVVLTAVVCLCRCCLWLCCCCCCRGGRIRMMKAPGRNCRIPRNGFESDPKGYFHTLRAHPGDQLC